MQNDTAKIGIGMNFLNKVQILKHLSENPDSKVLIMDTEGEEYERMTNYLGGVYVGNVHNTDVQLANFDLEQKNMLVLGTSGKGIKTISFKETEFFKKLAPRNAIIRHENINGENFVLMTY